MQRWLLGNESRSKMFINLHLSHTKTGNNSVTHIGANMIFGGILEGVWLINNQSKFLLYKIMSVSIVACMPVPT